MAPENESGFLADKLMANFNRRKLKVEKWNEALENGTYKPNAATKAWWKTKKAIFGVGSGDGKDRVGLAGAISDTFFWQFWSGGVVSRSSWLLSMYLLINNLLTLSIIRVLMQIKVIGDLAQITSPLVTKQLINFSTQSYGAYQGVPGYVMPPVGTGIGLALGLWAMQVVYALCTHQFFVRSAGAGVLTRAALIASIYRKSIVLSGKARVTTTNGKLINHISTDVTRIDFCMGFFHFAWTAIIQVLVIIALLIANLGVSSLAGVAFLFVALPFQAKAMKMMFALRKKVMIWTDKRAKLMQELLGGMRIIKFFSELFPEFPCGFSVQPDQ